MPTSTAQLGGVLQRRYRLDAGLGAGASARVFLAFDIELERHVAVKLFHPGFASDDQFFAKFRAEARAVAAFNHPNIVQIYDWGNDDGEPFLVLEYLAGGSLRDLLGRERTLGPAEVAQIGAQTARGLAFAHGKGVVHRDIKPANLLFDDVGVVHVADFGIARALVDATSTTEPIGLVFGTARYASPEQAMGTNVTDRSDVYSLALVCYEALVGRSPFAADTPLATLMARVNTGVPSSPELGPLAPVIAAATAADPRDRIDAATFGAELDRLASSLPAVRISIAPPELDTSEAGLAAPPPVIRRDDDTQIVQRLEPEDETPSTATEPVAAPRGKRHRLARRLAALAVVIALIVGGVAAYTRFEVYGHAVPKLIGLSASSARRLVGHAGLRIAKVENAYSSSAPAGEIVTQSLKPGTRVRSGTAIDVVLSEGHAPVTVPHVVGVAESAASSELRKRHFVVKATSAYNETAPVGDVITEQPASGSAAYGSTVSLEASLGPSPRTIPSLSGLTYAQAASNLTALRLTPAESLAYSNDVPAGQVVSSQPAAGATGIVVGSKVTVVISRGPLLVAVPSVAGDSISTAVAALEGAGLEVTEQVGPPFATTASTTDPAPGTKVKPGSSVTLYVA